jgi:hypothetical protein
MLSEVLLVSQRFVICACYVIKLYPLNDEVNSTGTKPWFKSQCVFTAMQSEGVADEFASNTQSEGRSQGPHKAVRQVRVAKSDMRNVDLFELSQ